MSEIQTEIRSVIPLKGLRGPLAVALGAIAVAMFALSILWPSEVETLARTFNARTDRIYSAVFTFQAVLFGAVLTIWSLIKARATRYVERLADSLIFQRFNDQLERRIIYLFVTMCSSFCLFIADAHIDWRGLVLALPMLIWIYGVIASILAIFDALLTARVVLR